MRLLTAGEMRQRDEWAIGEMGLPGLCLMENAGRQVAAVAGRVLGGVRDRCIWIFCGSGNNGGDGLVAARHLAARGAKVEVFLAGRPEDLRGDAAVNYLVCTRSSSLVPRLLKSRSDVETLNPRAAGVDLMVDALLGTGVRGPVEDWRGQLIDWINAGTEPVLSVDLPSGLEADSGACAGPVVRAQHTVTLDSPKRGLFTASGIQCAGTVWVADIGIPPGGGFPEAECFLSVPERVKEYLPSRPRDSHKGSRGRVLLLGGSVGMGGAMVLASQGALRSGAGLVTAAVPRGVQPQVAAAVPEVLTYPLEEAGMGWLDTSCQELVLTLLERASAVGVGPGLSQGPEAVALVRELLPGIRQPLVLDADALNALEGEDELLSRVPGPVIVTPHPGEMGRLAGMDIERVQAQRMELALEYAARRGVHVLLKGAFSLVASPEGQLAVNPTGNPGMATGGTGDVLTGVVAALLGQGLDTFAAGVLGAFVHGLAGDLAAESASQAGMAASDVHGWLPRAWQLLEKGEVSLPGLEADL